MKKIVLFLLSFVCVSAFAKQYDGLFFGFSMEENKYEDDNIALEIVGTSVYLTNKLNDVVYLDPKKTFFYEAGSGINETNTDIIMSVQPQSTICIHGFFTKLDQVVFSTRTDLGPGALGRALGQLPGYSLLNAGVITARYMDTSTGRFNICPQTDSWVDFIGVVGEMYVERKESKQDVISTHLTKDESIFVEKVSLAYSLNSELTDVVSVTVSTWVSDVFLSKYELEESGTKKKDGFASRKAKYTKINIMADSPFEDLDPDQEKSPIMCFSIVFGKGLFILENTWTNRARVIFCGAPQDTDKKKKK